MKVHIICRDWHKPRIVPRMAQYLNAYNGWSVSSSPDPNVDVNYFLGWYEMEQFRHFDATLTAAYFTHRETDPSQANKTRAYDEISRLVDLRVVTARMYGRPLEKIGRTVQIHAPIERDNFVIAPINRGDKPIAGVSGFVYGSGRKGERLLADLTKTSIGKQVTWKASGRGWPIPTRGYGWEELPHFYQSLNVFVCTSLVEGVPVTTLEALACGIPVVIPAKVGLHDELPLVDGIFKYDPGDLGSLQLAFEQAVASYDQIDRQALRDVTEVYSVERWCEEHAQAFDKEFADVQVYYEEMPDWRDSANAGIYYVAFGEPARACARTAIETVKAHSDLPIAIVSDKPLQAGEDVYIPLADTDIGGRGAKLRVYDLAPQSWQYVVYLDADTEVVGPIDFILDLLKQGWEFVITKDIQEHSLLAHLDERYKNEFSATAETVGDAEALVYNGGVWAFRRCANTKRFFERWYDEWNRWGERDQCALMRALYLDPIRIYVLGNEWNTFPDYTPGIEAAAINHYPTRARRWLGKIGDRLDSQRAWGAVRKWEKDRK